MNSSFLITPRGITFFLFKIIGVLLIFNLISNYLKWVFGYNTALGFVPLFDFDQEYNIPTFYSTLALIFCAYLLKCIANDEGTKSKKGKAIYWKGLSFLFAFLALDELTSIHNHFGRLVSFLFDVSAYLNESRLWVLAYIPFLILLVFVFFRFYLNLPSQTKFLFFISGIIFITGAIGIEIMGDQYMMHHEIPDIYYGLIATLEELFEMIGIVLFIRALVLFISTYSSSSDFSIHLHFLSESNNNKINIPLATSNNKMTAPKDL